MANEKFKAKIKGYNVEQLTELYEELKKELSKNVIEARKYGYAPSSQHSKYSGNVERTKKEIAIVLTIIKQKGG